METWGESTSIRGEMVVFESVTSTCGCLGARLRDQLEGKQTQISASRHIEELDVGFIMSIDLRLYH